MIAKRILWFGRDCLLACDAKCDKAWGINHRPKVALDPEEVDDFYWIPDYELGIAPQCTGIWEGGHGKPVRPEERLNKWCARECERNKIFDIGEGVMNIELRDFDKPFYNMPSKHPK